MRSKVHKSIWKELDNVDVEMAYPHTHVIFDETSGRARVAVEQSQGINARSSPSEQSAAD
jgi:hypothetical protein